MRYPMLFLSLAVLFKFSCQAPSNTHIAQKIVPEITPETTPDNTPEIPQYEMPEIKKADWITLADSGFDFTYNPKVDILFVVDNSLSMKQVQLNVSRNIKSFVNAFSKNQSIDFHFGVTTNWDHFTDKFIQTHPEGPGALKKISGVDRRYLKKGDSNLSQKLSQTLMVGILSLEVGGPEHEAFFSPVIGALEKIGHGDINEGFIRDEAHLVVILVTDADDATPSMTPSEAASKLASFKASPDMVSVYGVLVSKEDPDSFKDHGLKKIPKYYPHCFNQKGQTWVDNGSCPKAFGPERMENFIFAANSRLGSTDTIRNRRIMRITSKKFGQDLTRIAEAIVMQVSEKRIPLSQRPQVSPQGVPQVELWFGNAQSLEAVPTSAFKYLSRTNELRVTKPWKNNLPADGVFKVRMLPILLPVE